MGRTVPSFRMVIDIETRRVMSYFGRCVHDKKDREKLLKLLNISKRHSHAGSEAVRLFPLEAILFATLLERQKELESLEKFHPNLEALKLHAHS